MGNKWQIPVYVIVIALVAFLIWNFVKPPAANGDNTANTNTEQTKDKQPDKKRSPLQKATFDPGPGPYVGVKPPDPPKLDHPLHRAIVSGRVLESDGGAGIKDAKLTFLGQGDLGAYRGIGYSQVDGTFRFLVYETSTSPAAPTGKSQGRLHVVSPDGRGVVTEFMDCDASAPINLRDIVLHTQAVIAGRVTGPDGEPARGVCVNIRSSVALNSLDSNRANPSITTRPVYSTTIADDDGKFEFKGMDACVYRLSVDACYYGMSSFVEVNAAHGGSLWQELKLRRENYVRGVLADPQGRVMPGVVVRLEFPLPPGVSGEPEEKEPGGIVGPEAPPKDPKSMTPKERKEDHEKKRNERDKDKGKKSQPDPKGSFGKKQPERPKPPEGIKPQSIKCITDEYGQFGFTDLEDQQYILQAMSGENPIELLNVHVNLPDYRIELGFSNLFSGAVVDSETGKPITRFDVREVGFGTGGPESETKASPLDRLTDNSQLKFHVDGKFSLFNLNRKTRVRICAPGYVMRSENVMDLKPKEERTGQEFKLDPLCDVNLVVRQEIEPQKNVALPLEPVIIFYQAGLAFMASTDDLGQVKLPAMMPGTYDVQVQRADGKLLSGRVTVPAKSTATLEVLVKTN